MNTILYVGDTSQLKCNQALYDRLLEHAPAWRLDAINKLKIQSGKCQSLGAFILLYKALSDLDKADLVNLVKIDSKGKPYLPKDSGIYFNLSHSSDRAICLISDCEVGCDIEFKKQMKENIARRFFLESENALLTSLSSEQEKDDMFFRLWTLKESYMKVTGLGMQLPLNSFGFEFADDMPHLIVTGMSECADNKNHYFKEFFFDEAYAVSCCTIAAKDIQLKHVDFCSF